MEFWSHLEKHLQSVSVSPSENLHISLYERVEILCQRATQISLGAESKVTPMTDAIATASEEIIQGLIDMRIRRTLPNSQIIYINPEQIATTPAPSRFFNVYFAKDQNKTLA